MVETPPRFFPFHANDSFRDLITMRSLILPGSWHPKNTPSTYSESNNWILLLLLALKEQFMDDDILFYWPKVLTTWETNSIVDMVDKLEMRLGNIAHYPFCGLKQIKSGGSHISVFTAAFTYVSFGNKKYINASEARPCSVPWAAFTHKNTDKSIQHCQSTTADYQWACLHACVNVC